LYNKKKIEPKNTIKNQQQIHTLRETRGSARGGWPRTGRLKCRRAGCWTCGRWDRTERSWKETLELNRENKILKIWNLLSVGLGQNKPNFTY